MKSIGMKFMALLLATLSLLAVIGSAFCIMTVSKLERESGDLEQIGRQQFWHYAREIAWQEARMYAVLETSTAPIEVIQEMEGMYIQPVSYDVLFAGMQLHSYTIYHNGVAVSSGGTDTPTGSQCWTFQIEEIMPSYTQIHPYQIGTELPGGTFMGQVVHEGATYHLFSFQDMTFRAEVVLCQASSFGIWNALEWVWQARDLLPVILAGSALLLAVSMVYLCWAAGKKKGQAEIRPGGLNRLPLDLYVAVDCILGYLGLMLLVEGSTALLDSGLHRLAAVIAVADLFGLCLIVVSFVFCFASQVKAKGFWWRHSVIGFCLIKLWQGIHFCWRGVKAVVRLLPVMWQWLLTAFGMVLMAAITGAFAFFDNSYIRVDDGACILFFMVVLACVAIVLYGGWCFGTILKGARKMASGEPDSKINTRYFAGAFKDCGENLNALSEGAMLAAREQMKSERMKTELITNVSHDIKTPLTSIINYVDLLQQPHSEEEEAQYLEVLSRQALRLKKLTEDLVEMSKATTGNVAVELTQMDLGETVLQALGEFGDKVDSVPLSIVFRQPEEPVLVCADGRLSWRVMSNLLSNAVKYAQPGTRLYVDIENSGAVAAVTFKNISREPLNLSAEELMERFVRGDASRSTEGSGLGLNIAQSLMQVQGGDLQLYLDGDLFRVTLVFPNVYP